MDDFGDKTRSIHFFSEMSRATLGWKTFLENKRVWLEDNADNVSL